jgi:hypothetical protein
MSKHCKQFNKHNQHNKHRNDHGKDAQMIAHGTSGHYPLVISYILLWNPWPISFGDSLTVLENGDIQ